MNTNRLASSLSFALLAFTAAGCSSATMHFYTLDAVATAGTAPAGRYAVLVGPVEIPPTVDRPQFVVQVAPNKIDIDELNCWAAPLDDGIARTVAADLAVLLGTHDVAVAPLATFDATHRVVINVQRFESLPGRMASLDALWTVTPSAVSAVTRSGRTVVQETITAPGFDALAGAHSRLLAKMSSDIAAVIVETGKLSEKKKR